MAIASTPVVGDPHQDHVDRTPGLLRGTAALLCVCLLASGPFAAGATGVEPAGVWERTLSALNGTTPYPLASQEDQDNDWFRGAWGGIKRIWAEGTQDLYLSGRYWHMPWGFTDEDRAKYDEWALGGGYGRSLVDEKGNQRMLYALVVQDSFEKPMYLAGYGWLARWRIPGDLRVGAGYSLVIISNATASDYIPFPAPVPLASLGTDRVALYGTYFNSIFYFFAKLSF